MSKKNDDIDNNKNTYTQHGSNPRNTIKSLKIKKKLDKPCRNMVKYRLCRNRIFYFRIAIPTSLRSRFGRNEFIYSLRTSDSVQANQRCWAMLDIALMLFRTAEVHNYTNPDKLNERTKHHFKKCMDRFTQNHHRTNQSARGEAMTHAQMTIENNIPTKAQIKTIMKEVYNRWIIKMEEGMLSDVNLDHLDIAKRADNSMNCEQFFSDCLQERTYDAGTIPKDVQGIIDEYGLDLQVGSILYYFLCREYCKAGIEFCQLEYRRLQGDYSDDHQYMDATIQSPSTLSVVQEQSELLSAVMEEHLKDNESTGLAKTTLKHKRATFNMFLKTVGDTPIQLIDKNKARGFCQLLEKRPKGMVANSNLSDMVGDETVISISTYNKYLNAMKGLFTWAERKGYFEGANPFTGQERKSKEQAKDARDSFSERQMDAVFSSPVYTGCKSEGRRNIKGDLIVKDFKYWIPLIATYTGARRTEICQLRVTDIVKLHDVWCFDINENDDKELKTISSKRIVPIHKKLIDLGFLGYHQGMVARYGEREDVKVFPDVSPKQYTKQFTALLVAIDAKTKKTSFHSFRHTFIDATRIAGISEEISNRFVGHSGASVHASYGNGDISKNPKMLKKLKEEIDKVNYPSITLSNN